MRSILILFLFSMTRTGQSGIILNAISTAQDRIHSRIQQAAGTILGGISQGIHINAGLHAGFNNPPPPPPPAQKSSETIVIVVNEDDSPHGPPPRHNHGNNHQYHEHPNIPHGPYNPNQKPTEHQNPNQFTGGHINHHNQPSFPNNEQNYHNQGNNYQNNPQQNQKFDNIPRDNENSGYGNYGKTTIPPYNNNLTPNQGSEDESHNYQNVSSYPDKPNYGSSTMKTVQSTTEDTKKDYPYFVPLNPEDIGEQKDSAAPKRNTDVANEEDDDDDVLPIDIRIKN